jgi:aldehyde:ferredoxin oxidoreductase
MCYFVFAPRSFFPIHLLPDLVKSGTGWNTSMWELMKMGERGLTGARLINVKLGLDDNEDVIPQRLFEKIPEGPLAGKSVPEKEFYEARRLYYSLLGWNEHGVPEEDKILELGLK